MRAVQIETLVVGPGVLVVGADDVAPIAVPERARDVVLQPVFGSEQVPGEAAAEIIEDMAALLAAEDGTVSRLMVREAVEGPLGLFSALLVKL
jgi:hypothetical protein